VTHPDPAIAKAIDEAGDVPAGTKFDSEKTPLDLLDPYAIDQLGRVLAFGAKKYGRNNWRGGIGSGRLIAAALRHLFAFLGGEVSDSESGLHHIAHAMCCCMMLLGLSKGGEA
jgi:hypothetical protein